jgi:hypothetical protein
LFAGYRVLNVVIDSATPSALEPAIEGRFRAHDASG